MEDNIKVSVIIPIHDGGEYIDRCLECVSNQTLTDIEVLCACENLSDNVLKVIYDNAQKDQRIKLVKPKNQYIHSLGNAGKAVAKGEYLVFWGFDAFFEPTALEKMYTQCEQDKADICVCGVDCFVRDKEHKMSADKFLNEKYLAKEIPFNRKSHKEYILNFTDESIYNKMFKRSFIEKYNLDFQDIQHRNDIYFVICALCYAQSITVVNDVLISLNMQYRDRVLHSHMKSFEEVLQSWRDTCDILVIRNAIPRRSLTNKVLESLTELLCGADDINYFKDNVKLLKTSGLRRLQINDVQEKEYYNEPEYVILLEALLNSEVDEILLTLLSFERLRYVKASVRADIFSKLVKTLKADIDQEQREEEIEKTEKVQDDEELESEEEIKGDTVVINEELQREENGENKDEKKKRFGKFSNFFSQKK